MPQPIMETMGHTITSTPPARYGTCLWEYDGSRWTVRSLQSQNGGIAGDPPQQPGRFKGQLRMTPCVLGA